MSNRLLDAHQRDRRRKNAAAAVEGRRAAADLAAMAGMQLNLAAVIIIAGRIAVPGGTRENVIAAAAVLTVGLLDGMSLILLSPRLIARAGGLIPDGNGQLRAMRAMRRSGDVRADELAALLRAECDLKMLRSYDQPSTNRAGRVFSIEALQRESVKAAIGRTIRELLPTTQDRKAFLDALWEITHEGPRDQWSTEGFCCLPHRSPALPIGLQRFTGLKKDPEWQRLKDLCRRLSGAHSDVPFLTGAVNCDWERSRAAAVIAELLQAAWDGEDPAVVRIATRLAENAEIRDLGPLQAARRALA